MDHLELVTFFIFLFYKLLFNIINFFIFKIFILFYVYKTLITVVAPAITGIFVLRKEIVLLLSGEEYISATSSLSLLSVALFFCMGAWFWGQCILVPYKQEIIVFKITILSALVNIGLNFVLIPAWKEDAAALTTIIAEGLSFLLCGIYGRRFIKLTGLIKHYIKVILGCAVVFAISIIIHSFNLSNPLNTIFIVSLSVVFYFLFEILLNNESVTSLKRDIKQKFLR